MARGMHRASTRRRDARPVVVLAVALVLSVAVGLPRAFADPGLGKPGPANGQSQPGRPGDQADKPEKPEEPVGSPGTIAANASYGYAWPLAPDCDETPATTGGCIDDGRGFFQGQCTSWVAHRLSQLNGISFTNWYKGRHWGDADQWAEVARSLKIKPTDKPSPGDVAWYARGHVAYVESVNPDGSILMSEMNFDGHNGFRMVTLYPGAGWPDKFIHVADIVPGAATVVPVDTAEPSTDVPESSCSRAISGASTLRKPSGSRATRPPAPWKRRSTTPSRRTFRTAKTKPNGTGRRWRSSSTPAGA